MPRTASLKQLEKAVVALHAERQRHLHALAEIDGLFQQFGIIPEHRRGPGRPPSAQAAIAPVMAAPKRRRGRRRFATSGLDSILALVKGAGKRGVTTSEIVKHWRKEGRAGDGYTRLGELVKAKKLKRQPLKGQKGSRYTTA